jgi:hypothetical protein
MKKIDSDTRFYIDLDLKSRSIIDWGYSQRKELAQELISSNHKRIFISKGQYNRLNK